MSATELKGLAFCGNSLLRVAVRRNLVTFPAQIPAFMKPPAGNVQQRVVQLFFVNNWSVRSICERYRLGKKIAQNLISDWRVRAVAAGLIQEIQTEELERLVAGYEDGETGREGTTAASAPRAAERASERVAARFLTALEESCGELGLGLSREQERAVGRIVLGAAAPFAGDFAATLQPDPPALYPFMTIGQPSAFEVNHTATVAGRVV